MRDDILPNLMQRPTYKFALPAALLVIITVVAYLPVRNCGFVFDDRTMLTENPILETNGLYNSWFTAKQTNYWPVTWTSFWIEHKFFGLNPAGYHIVNVILHILCSILIWLLLKRLKIPCALLAAAIFAVHPVNVESVAWITQRKNLLSMLFFLLALLWYFVFDDSGRRKFYWLAVVAFILAMFSKGAVVAFPVVVLMYAWWRRGSIGRRDILLSIPLFAVSAVMSFVEIWFQQTRVIGQEVIREDNFFARLAGAGWAVLFYIYK